MMNPNAFGDPGKMSDSAQFFCVTDGWTNPNGDSGGVHINSGVPNHAYALLVDGGIVQRPHGHRHRLSQGGKDLVPGAHRST